MLFAISRVSESDSASHVLHYGKYLQFMDASFCVLKWLFSEYDVGGTKKQLFKFTNCEIKINMFKAIPVSVFHLVLQFLECCMVEIPNFAIDFM
jgi:hypothetical protein